MNGPDDTYMASYIYYVITLAEPFTIKGFTRNNRAEEYANQVGNARIFRHSRVSLNDMGMDLLRVIVRLGDGAKTPAQLSRRDLVNAAFGCLWAACLNTGKLESDPSQEHSMAKVREMRTAAEGKVKAEKAPKVVKEKAPDAFAKKKIFLTDKTKNPRREGTHGHKSMQLVLDKPGIAYEDYLAAGGRRVDLAGSIELKQVELK